MNAKLSLLLCHHGNLYWRWEDHAYFPLKDNLGSSRVINPAAVYDYLPFGEDMRILGGFDTKYRYTGQEYEEETDLYNYRARFYAQRVGLFLAPDPQGQFHSPYVAMGNNPVNLVDPDGEFAIAAAKMGLKIYSTFQMVRAAYGVVNGFRQGGVAGGIHGISRLGQAIVLNTAVGGIEIGSTSSFQSVAIDGIRRNVTSGLIAHLNGGNFSDGMRFRNFVDASVSGLESFLDENYPNDPILFITGGSDAPDEFDMETYKQYLREQMNNNEFNQNIKFSHSFFRRVVARINGDEHAVVSLKKPGISQTMRNVAGEAVPGSMKADVFFRDGFTNLSYANVTLHELGHAIFKFPENILPRGMPPTLFIMDRPFQINSPNVRFTRSQLNIIRNSIWGNPNF
ncbi:MAG: RHS repeat-associated core domain-containing protein [Cyclonatronaceae bacterium]